ncbi:hypothetical protein DFQ01_11088 [Paenibacillus cellulosilyticus]|uniref:Peptidase M56 BlaR1 n=1 Tax=Paenibacillus cellulosilyticus TaxID=375489 RepID=A0A2V2YSL4_9BACL|nr:peptidase M56 BlaR1 [Paenibacillus cellulosilyticus]PWW01198.1 hypothetical protein DFQ01_11088 [Paenibacillus cellulosilyticus]QKS46847.1 peptidase M56 BlaR1 [Paenibacillus cellulosilyticus]
MGFPKKPVIVGSVFVVGFIVGTLTLGGVLANPSDSSTQSTSSDKEISYPLNENGQTYGSSLDATSVEKEPDLVKAYGVDGTLGYVKSDDLNGPLPSSPEEALAQQRSKKGDREIPLYDVDGKTVIGKFVVQSPQVTDSK